MAKTTTIKAFNEKTKTYVVSFPNLPVVEYEVATPEAAVDNYRVQFNLSPDRPYKSYLVKEVIAGDK